MEQWKDMEIAYIGSDEKAFPPPSRLKVGLGFSLTVLFTSLTVFSIKWIFQTSAFRFPFFLTMSQMAFCTFGGCISSSENETISFRTDFNRYLKEILPGAALMSGVMICWNYSYLDQPVAYIQIMKVGSIPISAFLSLLLHVPDISQTRMSFSAVVIFVGLTVTNVSRGFSSGIYWIIAALLLDSIASVFTTGFGSDNSQDSYQWSKYCPVALIISALLSFCFEGPFVIWENLTYTTCFWLLVNAIATLGVFLSPTYFPYAIWFPPESFVRTIIDSVIVIMSSLIWPSQVQFLEITGYCCALGGVFFYKTMSQSRLIIGILVIAAVMFSYTISNEIQKLQAWSPGLPGVPVISQDTPVSNLDPIPHVSPDPPMPVENAGPLTQFLQSHGIGPNRTLFISMASEAYIEPMINFKVGLEKFNLGESLLVLCLDIPCVEAAKQHRILAYDGFLMNETEAAGNWHYPIARMKLEANVDLIDGGYNFIMVDGDVYLTGTRHPLSGMLPLTEKSWGIQFQTDSYDYVKINIGWYWARPTPNVREFFKRSKQRWDDTHDWDQWIMNNVRWDMMKEGLLVFPECILLPLRDYKSTMLFPWAEAYVDLGWIDFLNKEGVMVHYTMIFGLMKSVVAKHFGHWFNETYYIDSPRLLQPFNINGTTAEIEDQMKFAAHLAKVTGRTFMWPMTVNQTSSESGEQRTVPAISTVQAETIANIVPWVEATYLRNRRTYAQSERTRTTIPGIENLNDAELQRGMVDRCQSSDFDVLEVDFSIVKISEWQEKEDLGA